MTTSGYPVYGANGQIGFYSEFNHDKLTILIGCRGTCGIVNICEPYSYVTGNAMALDELNENIVDMRFLYQFLKHRGFRDIVSGTSQPQITQQGLTSVYIPLPPLPEQRRIAAILDIVDAGRAKRGVAIEKLDLLSLAVYIEMFGASDSNATAFPHASLKDIVVFRTGKLDSNAGTPNGKYPFFTCSRTDMRIDSYAFDCEALLLAGNNATADYSVKSYSGKFNAYQRTYVITLKEASHSYVYAKMALQYKLAELKRISKGSGTKYLTLELLNKVQIPLPPAPLQQLFARRIGKIEEMKTSYQRHLANLDALFDALQNRAFRGEL